MTVGHTANGLAEVEPILARRTGGGRSRRHRRRHPPASRQRRGRRRRDRRSTPTDDPARPATSRPTTVGPANSGRPAQRRSRRRRQRGHRRRDSESACRAHGMDQRPGRAAPPGAGNPGACRRLHESRGVRIHAGRLVCADARDPCRHVPTRRHSARNTATGSCTTTRRSNWESARAIPRDRVRGPEHGVRQPA